MCASSGIASANAPGAPRARAFVADASIAPGRHGIPADEVAENQRWRLLGAAAEVLAERGHVHTTSTQIAKVAGVSPATFYKHFDNVGACLLAAYVSAADHVYGIASEACEEGEVGWLERLGVAIGSILRFLAVEPATAKLLGSEAPAGEGAIARARGDFVERLAGLLASGRELRESKRAKLPDGTECHLVSGAVALLSDRVGAEEVERLPELGPELTKMLSAPYVT